MVDGYGLMDTVTQGTLVKWQLSNISVHSNCLEGLLTQTTVETLIHCLGEEPKILHF